MEAGHERTRRLAQNESVFRAVNERISHLAAAHGTDPHLYEFLCECSKTGCSRIIRLTLAEYEYVRRKGDRFALVAGHEELSVERVVESHDRFEVVEKVGEGSSVALGTDPRAA